MRHSVPLHASPHSWRDFRSKRHGRQPPTSRHSAVLEPGTRVYLSAVPSRPADESVAAAIAVRAAGLEPVPHVAVRNFASELALDDFLARLNGEAGVDSVLVIAGDRGECGPFRRALDAIDTGAAAPARHPHHRHRRISGGPPAHRRRRTQPRADGKDRRRGSDRTCRRDRHPVLLRRAARSSTSSRACARSASIIACASGLSGQPASRR